MAMGKPTSEQTPMWVSTTRLPVSPGHPFYTKLNAILDDAGKDRFAEGECQQFYAPVMGRPSLLPGRYFRLLLVGYFEGLDSERGVAWRAANSLAVRQFLGLGLDTLAPDHLTISRTRRLIPVETHRAVFTWVQERLVAAGLVKGRPEHRRHSAPYPTRVKQVLGANRSGDLNAASNCSVGFRWSLSWSYRSLAVTESLRFFG
jgi:transposase